MKMRKNVNETQELAKRLGLANSTVSDIIYGRNQCEKTKERIAQMLGING